MAAQCSHPENVDIQLPRFIFGITLLFQSGKLKADYKHEKLVFGADMNLSR